MKQLILLKYNNYSNRKIKKESSINDYLNYDNYYIPYKVNFFYNDFVNTRQTIDFFKSEDIPSDYEEYNYLLVIDEDNPNVIESRWFILDNIYSTQSQLILKLKRDSVVDKYDTFINSTAYIEKGFVNDESVLSVIKEPIKLNQIKKSETLLKDKTNSAYIVGYMTNNITTKNIEAQVENPNYTTLSTIATTTGISENELRSIFDNPNNTIEFTNTFELAFQYYGYSDSQDHDSYIGFNVNPSDLSYITLNDNTNSSLNPIYMQDLPKRNRNFTSIEKINIARELCSFLRNNADNIKNEYASITQRTKIYTELQYSLLMQFNNSIVRDGNNYYRVIISNRYNSTKNNNYDLTNLKNAYSSYYNLQIQSPTAQYFNDFYNRGETNIRESIKNVGITKSNYNVLGFYVNQFANGFRRLNDKPYSIFVIPFGEAILNYQNSDIQCDYNGSLAIAKQLIHEYNVGSNDAGIYDLQILPYFPMQELIENNKINVDDLVIKKDYDWIVDNETKNIKKGIIFYLTTDNFNVILDYSINSNENRKVVANCDMWRINSPNYQGTFEFNISNNGGSVENFIAYCTYKPYTPFIKVAPNFKYLYGEEYQDNRGCICGGDFSITQLSEAWTTYNLNNKNYQNIFNRDIQNLEFTQGQESFKQYLGGAFDIVNSAIKGGTTGAIVSGGNPIGATIGASAGALTSGVGYGIDNYLMVERHKEQLDYAKDKYYLNLANIQAIPNTLTKVSSFDIISKIYPFLEYYTCTEEEKELFKNKMQYEGYTLGIVDNIYKYIYEEEHYIKGKIIRINDETIDTHIANDLFNEFDKGLFIKGV